MVKKLIPTIAAVLAIIGSLYWGGCWVGSQVAWSSETKELRSAVQALAVRVDGKIESDNLTSARTELWRLEDKYGADPDKVTNPDIKQRMKSLQVYIKSQEVVVDKLRTK